MSDLIQPEDPQAVLARYREKLAERGKNLSAQIAAAPSNVIRTKGRVFNMPDGTTNQGPLRCVILDFVSSNSFFEGAYNPQQPKAPVCWAIGDADDLRPSANAPKAQHAGECSQCPKNQWGTATNGGKGKACKNAMKLALIPANLTEADVNKMYTITVSPTGIKGFSAYARRVQKLLGDDALPIRVITEVSFDPAQAYPTLVFRESDPNTNLGLALTLLDDAREMLMREPKGDDE